MKIAFDRLKKILTLAFPVILAMVANNIVYLVDTFFVGYLGDNALAGVGVGLFLNHLVIAIFLGLSVGVQTITARKEGNKSLEQLAASLNLGLLCSVIIGIPFTFIVYKLIPVLFPLVNSDSQVIPQGVAYLQALVLGTVGFSILVSFKGYWIGINKPSVYLAVLIVVNLINVVLAYLFVFGKFGMPSMGTFGLGLASSIAISLGAFIYLAIGLIYLKHNGFLRILPDSKTIKNIIELSIAEGIRQIFFAAAFTVLFYIIGKIGTSEVAAANVLINLMLVLYLPVLGFGSVVISLVSQAIGKNDLMQAHQWGWDVAKISVVVLAFLSIPLILFPKPILQIFIHSPTTLALAVTSIYVTSLTMVFEGVRTTIMSALLGAGDNKWVLVVFLGITWGLSLPIAYLLVKLFKLGLLSVWISQAFFNILMSFFFVFRWHRKKWMAKLSYS